MVKPERQQSLPPRLSIVDKAIRYAELLAIQAEARKMHEAANLRRGVEDIKYFTESGAEDVFLTKAGELSQQFDDVRVTKTLPGPEDRLMGMTITWDAEKDNNGDEISWKSVSGRVHHDLRKNKLIAIEGKSIRRIINIWNIDRVLSRAVRKAEIVSSLTDPKLEIERNGGEGRVVVDFKTPKE
jgi:hypothetical protein